MAGSAAAETVLFITSIVVASMVAGVLAGVTLNVANGIDSRGDNMNRQLRMSITILNDPSSMPYNNTTGVLDLYVRNTGKVTLRVNSSVVILDGRPYTSDNWTARLLPPTAQDWVEDTVLWLKIRTNPMLLSGKDYKLDFLAEKGGASAKIEFRL